MDLVIVAQRLADTGNFFHGTAADKSTDEFNFLKCQTHKVK